MIESIVHHYQLTDDVTRDLCKPPRCECPNGIQMQADIRSIRVLWYLPCLCACTACSTSFLHEVRRWMSETVESSWRRVDELPGTCTPVLLGLHVQHAEIVILFLSACWPSEVEIWHSPGPWSIHPLLASLNSHFSINQSTCLFDQWSAAISRTSEMRPIDNLWQWMKNLAWWVEHTMIVPMMFP